MGQWGGLVKMYSLPKLVSYGKIFRGKIFNVAIPFTSHRPLSFVVEDESNPNSYKIISKDYGFEPMTNPKTGKKYAPTVKIVTEFKLRPAIIIQSDELNHNPDYHSTIVIPISSITENDKQHSDIVKRMITSNDIDGMHYLGNLTGKDSYTTISDPKRLHKNMIFETKNEIILSNELMQEIMIKFGKCFEIKRISECEECKNNCKNCEYKKVVNE